MSKQANRETYNMVAPSADDSHTVKSAPQAVVLTSDTRQRTGDDSISAKEEVCYQAKENTLQDVSKMIESSMETSQIMHNL